MVKLKAKTSNEITVKNMKGYFEKTVTKFGTGAKIDCPKQFLRKKVIIIVKE